MIKFSKDQNDWFTVWNNSIISPYNKEEKFVIAMRRYLDETYNQQFVDDVIARFDARSYRFTTLACFKRFQKQMKLLKPSK